MSVKNKSVEEKMDELSKLVNWFESEDFVLEQASDMFKKAAELAKEIERDLTQLKNEITVVKKSFEES